MSEGEEEPRESKVAAEAEPATPDAPAELIIDAKPPPGDASDGGGTSMGRVALPIGGAALLFKFVSPTAGAIGLAMALAYLLITRPGKEPRTVLRVTAGELLVLHEDQAEPLARLPLTDVLDVSIDRKPPNPDAPPQQKERVRLAIERREAEPLFVPEQRITPLEAQEWFFQIRVFLRKQGWLPKDERNNPVDPPNLAN